MKRLFVSVIVAGIIAAAIPADAADPMNAGQTGNSGNVGRTTCFVGKVGKKVNTCDPRVAGRTGNAGVRPFWLP